MCLPYVFSRRQGLGFGKEPWGVAALHFVAGVHCCHGGGRESLPEVAYQSSKLLPRWCSAVCGNLLIEPRAGHFTILFGRQEVSDLALLIAAVFKWLVS